MAYNQNKLNGVEQLVIDAGLKDTGWESFDDFMGKAQEHMKRSADMYYNCVKETPEQGIDEEKECQDALDRAIKVLQLAKQFAEKYGF